MENVYPIDIKNDGGTETIYVEKIANGVYKCLESCVFIDFITYGCEIEAEELGDKLNFLGLYKESPFKTFRYVWSKEIVESAGCNKMKDEIIRLKGFWENAMGGFFIVHLPIDKTNELANLFKILKS